MTATTDKRNEDRRTEDKRNGATTAVLLASAVGLLALPSAVLAFATGMGDPVALGDAEDTASGFVASSIDPSQNRNIAVRALSRGKLFRFTPAGSVGQPARSVTVAVRVDGHALRGITVTGRLPAPQDQAANAELRIAQNSYSLGAARAPRGLATSTTAIAGGSAIDIPDLAAFKPSAGPRRDASRFSSRIALDEKEKTGRSPRTFEGEGEPSVDVSGSYRLTRNLNVTAGVRYQQERDRLVPLPQAKQDNQAVYVGTQFRF